MQELFPSLKILYLINCPEIESFPEGGLPFNLQVLSISKCKKLVNGRKEWRLPCLRELSIYHDGSDEEIEHWELPSSIHSLGIDNLKTLSSQHLKSLTSLQYLSIQGNLPQIQSMLEQCQFSSFSRLTSLQTLQIVNFPNLQLISESALPSSLSQLEIYHCPNLQSLPVKGMPSSFSKLYIHSCPLLTPLLEVNKGEYWPEIAHIPTIQINDECL
uniref:Disease resistance protein I2C-5 n=1 Tax=Solanum tuberosum TaxID=4113 RepID=M1BLZ8_SOLTU